MTRWLSIFALLVIAAVLANAQCSASCFVFDFHGAAEHNPACCTDRCSFVEHPGTNDSHTSCQHKHSALQYAEWDSSELYKASAASQSDSSVVAVVGSAPSSLGGLSPVSLYLIHDRRGVPLGNSGIRFFSVLRI